MIYWGQGEGVSGEDGIKVVIEAGCLLSWVVDYLCVMYDDRWVLMSCYARDFSDGGRVSLGYGGGI